jgi:hypothetical protein
MTHDARVGWLAIGLLVLGWDAVACLTGGETLSGCYSDALANPRTRRTVAIGTGYIVAHLLAPPSLCHLDPLHRAAERLRSTRRTHA